MIVNAANERLCHAGGIAGVIGRAAGRELHIHAEEYIQKRGNVKTGSCMVSPAFGLSHKFKKIIHAVGPIYDSKKHDLNV